VRGHKRQGTRPSSTVVQLELATRSAVPTTVVEEGASNQGADTFEKRRVNSGSYLRRLHQKTNQTVCDLNRID
jgi:hypothetical protein